MMRPLALLLLAACGAAPVRAPAALAPRPALPKKPEPIVVDEPRKPKISVDWKTTKITSEEQALELWQKIAPTGADWDDKLPEIPTDKPVAKWLALALLHGNNFACPAVVTTHNCRKLAFEIEPPKPTDGLDAPCLRRLLALWSIDQLDPADRAAVRDSFLLIAQLPPPESQLVSAVFQSLPDNDPDEQLLFFEQAWAAGQRDLVNAHIGNLDETHLIAAVTRDHIDGALEILSAEAHRPTYLAAVTDEQLATRARVTAINELSASEDKLSFDLRSALITATGSADCAVAAAAARTLDHRGQKQYLPGRGKARTPQQLMRGLCVLASYEALQGADEPSLMPSYLPAKGLERIAVTYDPLGEIDTDGDGDPHTTHEAMRVPRKEATMPDPEDVAAAMKHCTGTTCVSESREYRFTFQGGELTRLEIAERPPCLDRPAVP